MVLRRRFRYDRGCSAPIETRGVVADWDTKAERLTVWDTTQAPVVVRNGVAAMLGLSERQVRVVAPFIGGVGGNHALPPPDGRKIDRTQAGMSVRAA